MAKREVWIEEEEGRTTGAWFNKALAMRHVRNGRRVTRYVPDEPATEGWEAWALITRSKKIVAIKTMRDALPGVSGCKAIPVRVMPVEPAKRAKAKATKRGGAK